MGILLSPVQNGQTDNIFYTLVTIFFILFFVLGNFFTLTLFSVVMIQNFLALKEAHLQLKIQKRKKGIKKTIWNYIFLDLELQQEKQKQKKKDLKKLEKLKFSAEKGEASLALTQDNKSNATTYELIPKKKQALSQIGGVKRKGTIDFALNDLKRNTKWKDLVGFLKFHFSEKKILLETAARGHKLSFSSLPKIFAMIYNSGFVDIFFGIATLLNIALMLYNYYGEYSEYTLAQQTTNIIFTLIFFIEFLIHFHYSGIFSYFLKKTNSKARQHIRENIFYLVLDVVVLVVAVMENSHFFFTFAFENLSKYLKYVSQNSWGVKDPNFNMLVIIVENFTDATNISNFILFYRMVRLLRLIRLSQINEFTCLVFMTMGKAIPEIVDLISLYFLIVFIYSIAGVGLYGKLSKQIFSIFTFTVNPKIPGQALPYFFLNVPIDVATSIPMLANAIDRPITEFTLREHTHFRNFFNSFLTVIRISTGGNWDKILALLLSEHTMCSRKLGNCPPSAIYSVFYFVSFLILMFIILRLLLGIILNHFSSIFDIFNKLTKESRIMRSEARLSQMDKLKDYVANDILAMKETQRRLMAEVREKSREAEFLEQKVSQTVENLLWEIDEIWLLYCEPTSSKIKFSFDIKLEKLSYFLGFFSFLAFFLTIS